MTRTLVKICGVTRIDDAVHAVECGADAIGLNFVPGSPRCLTLEQGREFARALGPLVTTVGVVASVGVAREVLAQVRLSAVQTYDTTFTARPGVPHLLSGRVRTVGDLEALSRLAIEYDADGVLVDAYSPHALGGTGEVAPWHLLESWPSPRPLVLAGGLTPANVADAIRRVRPYAVDVASGVELRPGVKEWAKVRAFIVAVRSASS